MFLLIHMLKVSIKELTIVFSSILTKNCCNRALSSIKKRCEDSVFQTLNWKKELPNVHTPLRCVYTWRMSCVQMLTDDLFGLMHAELTDRAYWSLLKQFCSFVTKHQSQSPGFLASLPGVLRIALSSNQGNSPLRSENTGFHFALTSAKLPALRSVETPTPNPCEVRECSLFLEVTLAMSNHRIT